MPIPQNEQDRSILRMKMSHYQRDESVGTKMLRLSWSIWMHGEK